MKEEKVEAFPEEPRHHPQVTVDFELYKKLKYLGIIPDNSSVREFNVGSSDYSHHTIQPWSIWIDYNLDPWDADIVKRVLRTKKGESRALDYEKIIHICQEKLRQLIDIEEYEIGKS